MAEGLALPHREVMGRSVQDTKYQVRSGSPTKGGLTLHKSPNFSEPQFPYLQSREK